MSDTSGFYNSQLVRAQQVHGPGFMLDVNNQIDRTRGPALGWTFYETEQAAYVAAGKSWPPAKQNIIPNHDPSIQNAAKSLPNGYVIAPPQPEQVVIDVGVSALGKQLGLTPEQATPVIHELYSMLVNGDGVIKKHEN